jgi:DNA-binding transcriptional LysR family regulator
MATDLDLRKLRYFVAVARLLHFGRAAQELHIAQPVLSRQIRALETELGARLFVRDSHGVCCTDAGRQLLDDAVPLLAAAEAAQRRVVRAGRGPRRLIVGFRAGIVVTTAIRLFTTEHPDVTVDVHRLDWHDQAETLVDGRVDIAYVRLPVDRRGLRVLPLYTEPRVVVLAADHRLAGKESITATDLVGEPIVWHEDMTLFPDRPAQPASGHRVTSVEDKLEHVAAGRGVSVLPQSAAAYYARPDVRYVPVPELPPDQVCLATEATRRSPLLMGFVHAARQALQCPPRSVHPRSPRSDNDEYADDH